MTATESGDTKAAADEQMTLTEHLAELRTRIIRALLAIVIGNILVLIFYDRVLDFLRGPYEDLCDRQVDLGCGELIFTSPLEGFSTRLSVSLYAGLILALPVILWQIWRFIVPALHARERRYAIPFVLSSVLLFLLGGLVAYLTLTQALEFLIGWAGDDVDALFQVKEYIRLVGLMVAAFGIAFEFPVLLVFLQLVGVLSPQSLLRGWRYAVLVIFIIAAVITPSGDPYSMLAMALPMTLFYLLSVLIGRIFQKRKLAREAAGG
jgi:sec-independent protein translocase protein TatC